MTFNTVETDVETLEDVLADNQIELSKSIMLYNDDHNTFNHVINCLRKYCGHTMEQAEQCALIVHNNGKTIVKHGTLSKLKPIAEALLENHLSVKIEE